MSLAFKFEDFVKVCRACLEAFSDHIEITALLHAHHQMIVAGKDEYKFEHGMRFLKHNEYGFKSLATVASIGMDSVIEEIAQTIDTACKAKQWGIVSKNAEKIEDMSRAVKKWRAFWEITNCSQGKMDLAVIYRRTNI